mmetsp:Transcript_20044/g.27752  ORF Transcript_20044/g.27752 Transcript_20044/m.27752 type:complete len:252 (-) Transcript_20044:80-835(-)
MASQLGVREACSMTRCPWAASEEEELKDYSELLRKEVKRAWAQETTRQGINLAKVGKYTEALKCYSQALELDPLHRDTYVARGAAYANQGLLSEACVEFSAALEIDPEDPNAAKYLRATEAKVKAQTKGREADGRGERGERGEGTEDKGQSSGRQQADEEERSRKGSELHPLQLALKEAVAREKRKREKGKKKSKKKKEKQTKNKSKRKEFKLEKHHKKRLKKGKPSTRSPSPSLTSSSNDMSPNDFFDEK